MNDLIEKVKQGLRCCKNSYPKDCKHCPYEKDCTHHETCDILIRNALFVIESLQSENKIITENITEIDEQRGEFAMRLEKLRLENERLKAQKQKWLQNIADQQLAVSPTGYETEEGLAKRTGEWNGLQMAWEILTEGR